MNNYRFNSIISKTEADALKEMIFKRAREKAESFTQDVQTTYTSSVQNDIMELARDAFVANRNPFSLHTEPVETKTIEEEPETETPKATDIGFKPRNIDKIKELTDYNTNNTRKMILNKSMEDTMTEARAELTKKSGFIGALEFLNSQATISLVQKRGQNFDALA